MCNLVLWYFQAALQKNIEKTAISIDFPEYSEFYQVGFEKLENRGRSIGHSYVEDFSDVAGEKLRSNPDELERIALSIWYKGDEIIDDEGWLFLSQAAAVDIEAPIFIDEIKSFAVQGYSEGDYDTGYISNQDAGNLEDYLKNDHNEYFFQLQDEEKVLELIK